MRPLLSGVLATLFFAFNIAGTAVTVSAEGLPCSNPAPATQAQVDASNGGLTVGQMVCPKDVQDGGITNDAGAAKAYLFSIARNLRDSKAPPTKERINALNNSFAICEARFLKAYTDENGPIYVVSAFRCGPNSPASMQCDRTENARAGGAGGSNHQLGIAVDVNPANGDYAKVHAFARSHPQYGVWFRLGMGDKPHMEPLNRNNPSCSGVQGTPVSRSGTGTPFDNAIRQALGMQPPPPPPPMQQQPLPSQPVTQTQQTPPPIDTQNATPFPAGTCAQQTYCSQSDGNLYIRSTTCVDQRYQTCVSGCSGLTCNAPSSASSTTGTLSPLSGLLSPASSSNSQLLNFLGATSGTSAFGLISLFTNASSSASPFAQVGTATPIALNATTQDEDNATGLGPASSSVITVISQPRTPAAGTTGVSPQQTFTSNTGGSSLGYNGEQPPGFQLALANMKAILVGILNYLQPFGGRMTGTVAPGSAYAD